MRTLFKTGIWIPLALSAGLGATGSAMAQFQLPPWQPAPGGITNAQAQMSVNVIEVIDGLVYVGGDFDRAGGLLVNGITAWDGSQWRQFGPAATPGFEKVAPGNAVPLAVAKFNNELVVGGSILVADDGVTTIQHLARYDAGSQSWDSLAFGVSRGISNNGAVRALTTYGGQLIVAGDFTQVGAIGPSPLPANNIAAWSGSAWSALGSGLTGGDVYALAEFQGELYAAGTFNNAGGVPVSGLAKWNGTSWSDVGGGVTDDGTFFFAYAEALQVFNNSLYVGGLFTTAGGVTVNHIARWDGSAFHAVGGGVSGSPFSFFATGVYDLEVFNGTLIATGEFDTAGGSAANLIAAWNGTTWSSSPFGAGLQPGASSSTGGIALAAGANTLYVGGDFDSAGGVASPVLATFVAAPPLCPADFNGSGSVTVQDIFDFLAAYFAGLPSADFNAVGGVTVQDIFDYLAAYFTTCP